MTDAEAKVATARAAWTSATAAWSRDDASDVKGTILLGERVMFAATDLICALEDVVEERAGR